jgi:hypothetical protein
LITLCPLEPKQRSENKKDQSPMPLDESTIRERLRALIEDGVLPRSQPARLRGGLCCETHPCIACADIITTGEVELEVSTPVGVLTFLHSRCGSIWGREGV